MRWLDLALAATALVVVVNVLAVLVLAGASRVERGRTLGKAKRLDSPLGDRRRGKPRPTPSEHRDVQPSLHVRSARWRG
jgi:hypothetical protein